MATRGFMTDADDMRIVALNMRPGETVVEVPSLDTIEGLTLEGLNREYDTSETDNG